MTLTSASPTTGGISRQKLVGEFPTSTRRPRIMWSGSAYMRGRSAIVLAFISWLQPIPTWAHEVMMKYVAHSVQVTVGPTNIDVEVELTFNEIVSLQERKNMDRDQDSWISQEEAAAYLAKLRTTLAHGVELAVNGGPLQVFELYEPQLDLLGAEMTQPSHHVLRLSFFARTPTSLTAGQEIVLLDHLWQAAPAQCSFQAKGVAGMQVAVDSPRKFLSNPDSKGEIRSVTIKTVSVPVNLLHSPALN